MADTLLSVLDHIASGLGFIIAVGVGFAVLSAAVGIVIAIFSHFFSGGFVAKLFAVLLPIPVFVLFVVIAWRTARFAGGYIGSSTYPLQHLVRLFVG